MQREALYRQATGGPIDEELQNLKVKVSAGGHDSYGAAPGRRPTGRYALSYVVVLPVGTAPLSPGGEPTPAGQRRPMRGSSASRSPSPSKLMASTVNMIANPGKNETHQ